MKIAVVGSGGREHAIAWKLAQTNNPEDIFVLPGNGGTQNNVALNPTDFEGLKKFCQEKSIELIFVGPEDPLAKGIVDFFADTDIKVFGPDKKAARLEGSKIWAKRFMSKYGVATADFWMLEEGDDIEQIIEETSGDIVVKYDGLAAGKGVFVNSSKNDAYLALETVRDRYGETAPFLLEEKLMGKELSVIGFTDGKDYKLLLPSQDHKPVFDGDKGPNTGGMGAYCPVPFCDAALMEQIKKDVVEPTLAGIRAEGMNYKGVIYFGLMITDEGPRLLEYNVRFGDPETEVILPALKTDLLDLVLACFDGSLTKVPVEFNPGYFVDVVLTSGGYPGHYVKGNKITGINKVDNDILVFHAGTKWEKNELLTSGGRVLNVVGQGSDLPSAIEKAYQACEKIHFQGIFYRHDIGKKGLE